MPLQGNRPPFIGLKAGDLVLVQSTPNPDPSDTDWWMGWIVRCAHRAQCIDGTTMYEVKDADTGNSDRWMPSMQHAWFLLVWMPPKWSSGSHV